MLKQLKMHQLKPGMMVTQVITQNGPVRIRKVGMIKSEAMIKGLTEMGVSVVEVDEAQSHSLETDDAELAAATQAADSPTLTPTQRLMASDKQISVADRQLSQQFHRSLFMPAIDEMPSKWRLYVKPYVILSLLVITGFGAGFSVMQMPTWLAAIKSTQLSERDLNKQEVSKETSNLGNTPELVQGETTSVEPVLTELAATEPKTESEPQTQTQTQTAPEQQAPVQQRQTINGIVLNEGETVLGYNAPELSAQTTDQITDQTTAQTNDAQAERSGDEVQAPSQLSADLLRRVNQAAARVDSESNLPLNDLEQTSDLTQQMFEEVKRQGLIPVIPSGTASARAEPLPRPGLLQPQAATRQGAIQSAQTSPMQRIDQLPASVLTQMPSMSFSAHMYASNPPDRWVRVNSRRLSEGDFIVEGLSIVEIAPENIVLSFKGQIFTMNALSDW